MHKARLPHQAFLDEEVQKLASSPCGMSESDPAYFGYWSKEDVLTFLKDLLETERVGLRAFAAVGRAVDLRVADLVFESELAQGAICVLLKKEMAEEEKLEQFVQRQGTMRQCQNVASKTRLHSHVTIKSGWQT